MLSAGMYCDLDIHTVHRYILGYDEGENDLGI